MAIIWGTGAEGLFTGVFLSPNQQHKSTD